MKTNQQCRPYLTTLKNHVPLRISRTGRPKKLRRKDVSIICREVHLNPKFHGTKLAPDIAESS